MTTAEYKVYELQAGLFRTSKGRGELDARTIGRLIGVFTLRF